MTLLALDSQQKNRFKNIVKLSSLIVSIGILFLIAISIMGIEFKCPIYNKLHWSCPGCGGSRMLISLVNLEIYQAFRWNPFLFITLPILSIIYIIEMARIVLYNSVSKHIDKILIAYAISSILFGVIRNIAGFEWLLPTNII